MPAGRPSSYSEEIANVICDLLMDGMSMRQICEFPEMPARQTIDGWMDRYPDFRAKCERAREWQADLMDERILAEAESCTADNAQAAKVRISAYQWRASKLASKK